MEKHRAAMFLQGTEDLFLRNLGVAYGQIVMEVCDPIEVVCIATGRHTLREGVERQIISTDTAGRLEADMAKAGLCSDMRELFKHAERHPMPSDLTPVLGFKRDMESEIDRAMRHGHIVTATGKQFATVINTLSVGLAAAREFYNDGLMRMFDLCALMQSLRGENLAADDFEYRERWEKLPEEIRTAIEAERRAAFERVGKAFKASPLGILFGLGPETE